MEIPKNSKGMKFLMKNGRMGKIVSGKEIAPYKGYYRNYDVTRSFGFNVRAIGRTKNRNVYSYFMSISFLEKNVIMWFEPEEIKIMYKVMEYQNEDGRKEMSDKRRVKHIRVVKYL